MTTRSRQLLIALLVGAFCVQTWMVYADPTGRQTPPLSPAAERGRELWHDHNCQSCHQLYGFGGFLGPDLTNATERLTEARLENILSAGSGQMPPFHLPAEQRADIASFLEQVSATGTGQARIAAWQPPDQLLALVTADGAPARGRELALQQNCVGCHLPNHASDYRSPDLTTAVSRLGEQGVLDVLANGVPGTAMPRFGLASHDQQALLDFLVWLEANGESIRNAFEVTRRDAADWSVLEMAWWEF